MNKKWFYAIIIFVFGIGIFAYQLNGYFGNKQKQINPQIDNSPARNSSTTDRQTKTTTGNFSNQTSSTESAPIVIAPINQVTNFDYKYIEKLREKISKDMDLFTPSPSKQYVPYLRYYPTYYLCNNGIKFGIYDTKQDKILNLPETINSQPLENGQKIVNQINSVLWLKDGNSLLIIANPYLCHKNKTDKNETIKRLPPKAYILSMPDMKLTSLGSKYITQKSNQLGFEITYPIDQYAPKDITTPEFRGGIFALRLYQNPPPIEFGAEFLVVVFDKNGDKINTHFEDFIKNLDIALKEISPVKLGKNNCFSAQESQYSDGLGIEISNSYYFCEANNKVYMMKFRTLQDNTVENKIAQSIKFFPPNNP